MERIDDAYETKMVAFEIDCNDGKGKVCQALDAYLMLI